MSVYRRGKNYWIDYRYPPGRAGKRIREKVGPDKEEAQIVLAERLEAIRHGQSPRLRKIRPRLFEEILVEYLHDHVGVAVEVVREDGIVRLRRKAEQDVAPLKKDVDGAIENCTILLRAFDGKTLQEIDAKAIVGFRSKRLAEGIAKTTFSKQRGVLVTIFNWASDPDRGYFSGPNPVKKVKRERDVQRVRYLEPNEIARLEAKLPDWFRRMAIFARFTAARRGEILRLTWNAIDMRRGIITFAETKSGEPQHVLMNETVKSLLRSLPTPVDRSQLVFGLPDTKATHTKMARAWREALEVAKVKNFRFHDLRHQAATDLISQGATLYDVQTFLRHRSPIMSQRYGHQAEAHRLHTARLLDSVPQGDADEAEEGK